MPEVIIFVAALIAAIRGADWVGKASIGFAKRLGVSNFVIGATFVALATSLPELTTATFANLVNHDPLFGLGNVLGSPIINLGLILGLLFIVSKNRPSLGYYSRAVNVFIVIALILFVISISQPIGGFLSISLIIAGVVFLLLEYLLSQKSQTLFDQVENRFEKFISFFHLAGNRDIVLEFIFGVGLLLFGCKFLVDSGVAIASNLGVDHFFISATVLAIGTSLPELITMTNSLVKKRNEVSIGNLVGSSVINLTLGVGLATLGTATIIPAPFNYLFFITILALGILCLLVILPRFRVEMIGGLLFASAVSFLILISVWEITSR